MYSFFVLYTMKAKNFFTCHPIFRIPTNFSGGLFFSRILTERKKQISDQLADFFFFYSNFRVTVPTWPTLTGQQTAPAYSPTQLNMNSSTVSSALSLLNEMSLWFKLNNFLNFFRPNSSAWVRTSQKHGETCKIISFSAKLLYLLQLVQFGDCPTKCNIIAPVNFI